MNPKVSEAAPLQATDLDATTLEATDLDATSREAACVKATSLDTTGRPRFRYLLGMRVFAQALDLVDDPARIEEYIRHHRSVWPEVTDGLRAIGIRGMRIWRGGTRLFMLVETDDDFDPARYQSYASNPRTQEWDALMRTFQRRTPFARDGEWWSPLEEIFDLAAFPTHAGAAR